MDPTHFSEEAIADKERKEVIQLGSKMYIFPRLPFETDQVYFARRMFLTKMAPKSEKKFLDATRLSMIWANVHFLKCLYPAPIMKDIKKAIDTFG
jgi:hypothetical protein